MSLEVARDDLVTAFIASWEVSHATIPTFYENVKGEPTGVPFILIRMATILTTQPCLGRDFQSTWERTLGDCILALHVPVDYEEDGMALAEDARRVLSQQRFNKTITEVGSVIGVGVVSDGRYFLYNIRIPFRTDTIKEE